MTGSIVLCAAGLLLVLIGQLFGYSRSFPVVQSQGGKAGTDASSRCRLFAQTRALLIATGGVMILLCCGGMLFGIGWLRLHAPVTAAAAGGSALLILWLRKASGRHRRN